MAGYSEFCPKCGSPMQGGAVCPGCGYSDRFAPAPTPAFIPAPAFVPPGGVYAVNNYIAAGPDCSRLFTDPAERFVGALGYGHMMRFLADGAARKGFAVLSDRRVYFRGSLINIEGKRPMHKDTSKIVDIRDVTGTSVTTSTSYRFLHAGIMFLLLFALFLFMGIMFIKQKAPDVLGIVTIIFASAVMVSAVMFFILQIIRGKTKLFQIDFVGGCIAFNIRKYGFQECDGFQRMLLNSKDNGAVRPQYTAAEAMRPAMPSFTPPPAAPQPAAAESAADELMKYADLRAKNMITEEEYARAKADILAGKR